MLYRASTRQYLLGSNQYVVRVRRHKTPKRVYFWLLFLLITYSYIASLSVIPFINQTFRSTAYAPTVLLSPIAKPVYAAEKTASTSATMSTQEQEIDSDIKQVFGKYYPKAMLLLKGNGKPNACHENAALNPTAMNDNTTWGGVGRDWGVFQINDTWQGVTNVNFLTDPAINIRMAWNIFKHNGYTFDRWTCGKVYGI